MLKIAIATKSPEKIKGIITAFSRFFHIEESEIESYYNSTDSGVSHQPFGDTTYQGAFNRVQSIRHEFPNADFYIGCEAGIECSYNQYFNVQVICIVEKSSQRELWGKSAGWSIPSKGIETIRKKGLDCYLREKGLTCIQELLGDSNSRESAVAQATELALATKRLIDS